MGRREIAEAAGQSNRFLDRPVRAMDQESGVGTDLAELRRTIEDLDPGKQGNLLAPKKLFGIIPFGNKLRNYFDSYKTAQGHIAAILDASRQRQGRVAEGQCRDRYVERQNLWGGDEPAGADDPHLQGAGRPSSKATALELEGADPCQGEGDPRDRAVLRAPAHARISSPRWR